MFLYSQTEMWTDGQRETELSPVWLISQMSAMSESGLHKVNREQLNPGLARGLGAGAQ